MNWIQVTVHTTTAGSELVSQALIDAGSAGTMIEDRNDVLDYEQSRPEGRWDILDEKILQNMGDEALVSGYYVDDERMRDVLADIRARMAALRRRGEQTDFGTLIVETVNVDDEDWAENWKKSYVPFRLGRSIVVRPGWTIYEPQPGDRVIELDPGMAFGTGTHETTALCAGLLEEMVQPGQSVVDVGTGTGILAICAALMGAGDVLATDIDPLAIRVARENLAINGLADRIRTRQGDLLDAVDEVFDIAVANIIADVVCGLAAPIRAHIRPGGLFICSGIAREKQDAVLRALRDAGYTELDIREKGEWAAIACRR